MKNGTFTWRSHDGRVKTADVRECPNPAVAREVLEGLMGTPVTWRERVIIPGAGGSVK